MGAPFLTDSDTDCPAKGPHGDHNTACYGDELRGHGKLSSRNQRDQRHAQPDAHKNGEAPDFVPRVRVCCAHASKEDDEDDKGADCDPPHFLRLGAVKTNYQAGGDVRQEHDPEVESHD